MLKTTPFNPPSLALICLYIFFVGCGAGDSEWAACNEGGECAPVIEVKTIEDELPLKADDKFWVGESAPPGTLIDLGPQMITVPQWPDPSIKKVFISAAKNGNSIAIRLEWKDASVDNKYGPSALYTDQAAIMFPMEISGEPPAITMGNEGGPVNLWLWKAVWQRLATDSEKSAMGGRSQSQWPVDDLNAEGFSTLTAQSHQDVMGQGLRTGAGWGVVFKRRLKTKDSRDVQLTSSAPMAVAVWDGGNRETNGQKGLAGWILLRF